MATHSSSLAWKIPWMEKPGAGYSPWGRKELDTTERLHFHFQTTRSALRNSGSLTTLLQRGTHAQVPGEGFHPQERQRCERAAGAARGTAPRSPQGELGTVSRPISSTSWSGAPGCAQCRRTPSSASAALPRPWAQQASPRRATLRVVRRPPSPAPPPPPPRQPPGEEPAGDTDGTHPRPIIARIWRGRADRRLQQPIGMRILTLSPNPASGPRPVRASATAEEASRNLPRVPLGSGSH